MAYNYVELLKNHFLKSVLDYKNSKEKNFLIQKQYSNIFKCKFIENTVMKMKLIQKNNLNF